MTKNRISEENYNRLVAANKPYLYTFFNNVDILARSRYGSRKEAIRQLKAQITYSQDEDTVKAFKDGKYVRCDMLRFQAWCLLFGVPLERMLFVDMSNEELK